MRAVLIQDPADHRHAEAHARWTGLRVARLLELLSLPGINT